MSARASLKVVPDPRRTVDGDTARGASGKRFICYEVPSDYMRPSFEPGDRVEIDTSITQAKQDGVYLLAFPLGEPALRRIQVMIFTGRLRVYCDRDAGSPTVASDEYMPSDIVILGRARRFFRETWLWRGE